MGFCDTLPHNATRLINLCNCGQAADNGGRPRANPSARKPLRLDSQSSASPRAAWLLHTAVEFTFHLEFVRKVAYPTWEGHQCSGTYDPSMSASATRTGLKISAANRFGWDYQVKAAEMGPPVVPIIDAHSHIHGEHATPLYDRARRLFGVARTYSMTQLPLAAAVRRHLGDSVRFIAIPTWSDPDRNGAHRSGYLRTIERFAVEFGSRMLKVWASPRLRDFVPDGACDLADIDSPIRREHCRLGASLDMMYMVHVADPDTWFKARYSDSSRYGTKPHQYVGLERMLDEFTSPWVAAHMGGWPEDLRFLDALLERHPNLNLDTSATKWVVRELGRHPRGEVAGFFAKHRSRILFGSDLVVMDDQLSPSKTMGSAMGDLADSPESAFELYCSRYWALRTLFETDCDGESPIADPDLMMVEPSRYDGMSAPRLCGLGLDRALLRAIYHDNTANLLDDWWSKHP